jgi:hypothetical protein
MHFADEVMFGLGQLFNAFTLLTDFMEEVVLTERETILQKKQTGQQSVSATVIQKTNDSLSISDRVGTKSKGDNGALPDSICPGPAAAVINIRSG